jgi:preprotein translocase subunit SecF
MQILNNTQFDFLRLRRQSAILSAVLLIASLLLLAVRGLNFGIDFTGGLLIEVAYPAAVELAPVRERLAASGFGDAVVQHFGAANELLIRLAPREGQSSAQIADQILLTLRTTEAAIDLRRIEFVGPQVGEELAADGGLALLYALIAILIYISMRFEYRFSLGAVAALLHDVVLILGFFALTQMEFDLTVLAALLAVIGYSLNDTIVVFDRIREGFRKIRKGTSEEVVNISLNQTLSRTLMTSFTTLLVLIALFILGGALIHSFATALIVGVIVGTYSSIYVASSIVLKLGISREDLLPVEKEGADLDSMP